MIRIIHPTTIIQGQLYLNNSTPLGNPETFVIDAKLDQEYHELDFTFDDKYFKYNYIDHSLNEMNPLPHVELKNFFKQKLKVEYLIVQVISFVLVIEQWDNPARIYTAHGYFHGNDREMWEKTDQPLIVLGMS